MNCLKVNHSKLVEFTFFLKQKYQKNRLTSKMN